MAVRAFAVCALVLGVLGDYSKRVIVSFGGGSPGLVMQRTNTLLRASKDKVAVGVLSKCLANSVTLSHVGMQIIDCEKCATDPTMLCDTFTTTGKEVGLEVMCETAKEVKILGVPNDPSVSRQWGMSRIGMNDLWGHRQIQHAEDVVVAVIDTGVDYRHEDLYANIWVNPKENCPQGTHVGSEDKSGNGIVGDCHGANFENPFKPTGDPWDNNSHGTHCAGVIGAIPNNGIGIAGVNANVKIMALKFLGASGSGSTDGAVAAIDYAIANGANVMSNSWGGGGRSESLEQAIKEAGKAGILFLSAAGNDIFNNNDYWPTFPCNYKDSNTACIASTNDWDWVSLFSNYGKGTVDLAAPGSNIYSTVPNNRYASMSGTSMATPLAAGVAAMVYAELGVGSDPQEVFDILVDTTEKISWWDWFFMKSCRAGGVIDAKAAVAEAVRRRTNQELFE